MLSGGVLLNNLLEHAPVGARLFLWYAPAPLQVHGVHFLADVVPELLLFPSDLLLESRDCWACMNGGSLNIPAAQPSEQCQMSDALPFPGDMASM